MSYADTEALGHFSPVIVSVAVFTAAIDLAYSITATGPTRV